MGIISLGFGRKSYLPLPFSVLLFLRLLFPLFFYSHPSFLMAFILIIILSLPRNDPRSLSTIFITLAWCLDYACSYWITSGALDKTLSLALHDLRDDLPRWKSEIQSIAQRLWAGRSQSKTFSDLMTLYSHVPKCNPFLRKPSRLLFTVEILAAHYILSASLESYTCFQK
jgi:hypothetical protein